METELHRLLEIANTTIPNLVEAYNQSSAEYNELVEEAEASQSKLSEYEIVIARLTELTEEQGIKLRELQEHHNNLVKFSNDRIVELEDKLRDAKTEIKTLNALKPLKLQKTNQEQKVKLADRLKALDAEKGKHRNTRRELESVQKRLNEQKIGFWRNRQERLIENLSNDDLTLSDLKVEVSMEHMVWWQHECGLKLLFGYDKASEQVYCCDVIDPDTNKVQQPSAQAYLELKNYFKGKL